MVVGGEGHKNVGVRCANRGRIAVRKIGGFFNTPSRGSAQVKLESATVNTGEEILAQPGNQNCQRAETAREERNQESTPVMETKFQRPAIAAAKSLEGCFKTLLKSHQRIAGRGIYTMLFLSPQEILGHGWNDGA